MFCVAQLPGRMRRLSGSALLEVGGKCGVLAGCAHQIEMVRAGSGRDTTPSPFALLLPHHLSTNHTQFWRPARQARPHSGQSGHGHGLGHGHGWRRSRAAAVGRTEGGVGCACFFSVAQSSFLVVTCPCSGPPSLTIPEPALESALHEYPMVWMVCLETAWKRSQNFVGERAKRPRVASGRLGSPRSPPPRSLTPSSRLSAGRTPTKNRASTPFSAHPPRPAYPLNLKATLRPRGHNHLARQRPSTRSTHPSKSPTSCTHASRGPPASPRPVRPSNSPPHNQF